MRSLFSSLAVCLSASFAAAQSFNIDVGDNLSIFPAPSNAYGAAAVQAGTWSSVVHPYSATLTNLDGTASTVTTSSNQSSSYNYFPSALTGDDRNFMIDIQDLPSIGGPWTWTFNGLQDGNYLLYTYAWAPENNGNMTLVTVAGSSDGPQSVGASWSGSPHVLGVTYALHHLVAHGAVTVQAGGQGGHNGAVNGFQLVFLGGPTAFCSGDGSLPTACPCANAGAVGNGCANSANPAGANLTASGVSNPDTIVLMGSGMPATVSCIYLQGDADNGTGAVFGDGVRCADGFLIRLRTKSNVGGASQFPDVGDPLVSVRGMVTPGSGAIRHYQTYYRNSAAAFCPPETFNVTNGMRIIW